MRLDESAILEYRREKDDAFRKEEESPIPASERPAFRGLDYFPPSADYVIPTKLVPEPEERAVVLGTSDGQARTMRVAGRFDLVIKGEAARLFAYHDDPGDDHLFIPFKDPTAPQETYGAGRYLDLPLRPGKILFLDFNYAYNPYCAYNDEFSCPFPPQENWLKVPIRAGEKTYRRPEAGRGSAFKPSSQGN